MKRKYLLTVRVNRATTEFKEGMGVGVLSTQEVEFDLPDEYNEGMLRVSIAGYTDQLLRDAVSVEVKELQ